MFGAQPPGLAPLRSLGNNGNFLKATELGGVVQPCPRLGTAPLAQCHCAHRSLTRLPSSSPSSPSSGGSSGRRLRARCPGVDLPLQSWCSEAELRPLAVRCNPGTCSVSGRSKELLASRSREPPWRRSLPTGLARSSSELSSSSWLSWPSPDNRDRRSPLGLLRFRLDARPRLFRLERLLVQLLAALQGLCGELRALG